MSLNLVEASVACRMAGMTYGEWHYKCEVLGIIKPPTAEQIKANTKRKKQNDKYNDCKEGSTARIDAPVTAYNVRGEAVMTYPSVRAAAQALGKPTSGIYRVCDGLQKTAHGFQWQYADCPPPKRLWKKQQSRIAPKKKAQCPECGKTFTADKRMVYCSAACTDAARRKRVIAFNNPKPRQNRKPEGLETAEKLKGRELHG